MPPNAAASGARRDLFGSALEQSEQLFAAAEDTGPPARPILLFYGLSQAGRAIVAAHGEPTTMTGHGIRATDLGGPLAAVGIRDHGKGLFRAVASALESPSLPESVLLEQLYAALPATVEVLLDVDERWPPALRLQPERLDGGAHMALTSVAPAWLRGLPRHLLPRDIEDDPRPRLNSYLDQYPTLQGGEIPTAHPVPVPLDGGNGDWGLKLHWPVGGGGGAGEGARQARIRQACVTVAGSDHLWVLPALSGGRVIAPLVSWWGLLYALSMLARYEPAAWIRILQVDHSANAVAVEMLLEAALQQVPELICASLVDPTHWRPPGADGKAPSTGSGDAGSTTI